MSIVYRSDMTVQSALEAHPNASWVLGRLGIDPDGHRTISDAAKSEQLPVDLLLAALEATDPAAGLEEDAGDDNFEARFQEAITNFIEMSHHVFMRVNLPRLEQLLDKAVKAHPESHDSMLESLRGIFLPFRANVERHLEIEEEILFPRLRNVTWRTAAHMTCAEAPAESSPSIAVEEMEHEHELVEKALREMRALTCDYTLGSNSSDELAALYDGLQELERDLAQHIRLENDYLWPAETMQIQPAHVSHAPKTGAPAVDEASLICPRTNQRCEQGSPAECSDFWDCVRQAMHQRWEATDKR